MQQVENITTELVNEYKKQLFRQKISIINELKLSEKSLLQIITQNPKCLKIESLNMKLEAQKPEPINVELSAVIGLNHFRKRLKDQLSDHQVIINDEKLGLVEIKILGFFGRIIPLNKSRQDPRTA